MSEDGFRVPAWHAQHPNRSERYPLCGTVDVRGRPTHRVSLTLPVTCAKCLKALENVKRHNDKVKGPPKAVPFEPPVRLAAEAKGV